MRGFLAGLLAAPLLVTAVGLPATADDATADGRVDGVVYFDLNGDRQQQPDESGAAGFTVSIRAASSGGEFRSVQTDENGNYSTTDLPYGKYSVQLDGAGHEHTTPSAVGTSVTSGSGGGPNFGIK